MSVFNLRSELYASELIPCLESRAKVPLAIIFVGLQEMVRGEKTLAVPGRGPAHWPGQRRRTNLSLQKFPAQRDRQGSQFQDQRIRSPRSLTLAMHRILVES